MKPLILFFLLSVTSCSFGAASLSADDEIDFAHQIAPLLSEHCGKCHSGGQKEGAFSINTRESLIAGGESGDGVIIGQAEASEMILRVTTDDDSMRMPPADEQPLNDEQIKLLKRWIDSGLTWEPGFSFAPNLYEPPLRPRQPTLPPAIAGRTNPLDRFLDQQLTQAGHELPTSVSDEIFLRRAFMDLIGLLPSNEEYQAFQDDRSPDKRQRMIRTLLERNVDYAEHWLTFWNDLLRNDYTGTGFITGGRKQISAWLYEALVSNRPYDQFVRELIAPPSEASVGFIEGIRWRGEVSAGQTVEIQFAQNVGQAFLGINLKCASCHDSFIDRWTLDDAYGLAAVYATTPLELHRCDKPIGKKAEAKWLFGELGQIDPAAPQPERLRQLADLMTHRDNGRFTRTIVNRLWHRMMGRGLVHPTDAMQSAPWNEDLLDYLAEYLVEQDYDLKKVLELIATSAAYGSQAEVVREDTDADGYQYAGPRSKRMTAEQFMDAVWQLTTAAPMRYDAPVVRGEIRAGISTTPLEKAQWIWNQANSTQAAAGETFTFRKEFELAEQPEQAFAVITCDNSFVLYLNGQQIAQGSEWNRPVLTDLPNVRPGRNELLVVASNGGQSPNAAGLFFAAKLDEKNEESIIVSDGSWQWSPTVPAKAEKVSVDVNDWQQAVAVEHPQIWAPTVTPELASLWSRGASGVSQMVRASLVKSDFLMRSLGRPNRDQIVSVRPVELTTLEAIDLSNGEELAAILRHGASTLRQREWADSQELIDWIYRSALCRTPTASESKVLKDFLGDAIDESEIEDVLWSVIMLPEFQIVR